MTSRIENCAAMNINDEEVAPPEEYTEELRCNIAFNTLFNKMYIVRFVCIITAFVIFVLELYNMIYSALMKNHAQNTTSLLIP